MDHPPDGLAELVLANRILANEGILDGFGHASVRVPGESNLFWLARLVAPAQVTSEDIMTFNFEGEPVGGEGRPFLERFIHSSIYAARPDVHAVVHSHSSRLISLGVAGVDPTPQFHMAGFLGTGLPTFEIRTKFGETNLLIDSKERGDALAMELGMNPAALMRGHGAVVVGSNIQEAVFRSYYLNENAKIQIDAAALGGAKISLTKLEAHMANEVNSRQMSRPWSEWLRRLPPGANDFQ